MNVLCLVLDRLHLGYWGAYGNSWIDTPEFDRLATSAVVFDQAIIDSPRLDLLYRSYWQGLHALDPQAGSDRLPLARLLDDQNVHTILMTDSPEVLNHPLAEAFREYLEIPSPQASQSEAETLEDTHLAQCFAQLISQLETGCQAGGSQLLWCHLAGLGTVWDAPDEQDIEEGDLDPSEVAAAPKDAYAAQITVLDTCLGALLEFLDESSVGRETLLIVTGARGFPLLGESDHTLSSSLVHVPLVIRMPDGCGAGTRSQALVEPSDLWATILDWHLLSTTPGKSLLPIVRDEVSILRQRLGIRGEGGERAIRIPGWYLQESLNACQLFAKPDDLWEVNNVADRCQEIVEALRHELDAYCQSFASGGSQNLPPLSDLLLAGPG